MMDILAGLRETSFLVVLLVMGLGTLYLVIEGRTVKEIAVTFQPEFTTKAGFFNGLLQWFLPDRDVWGGHLDLRGEFLS